MKRIARRSAVVDLLAAKAKPLSTRAIADALKIALPTMCTRVRQLEEAGRIKAVGTATRTRDVRWVPADPSVIGRRPKQAISFRAAAIIESMQSVCRARLQRGQAMTAPDVPIDVEKEKVSHEI